MNEYVTVDLTINATDCFMSVTEIDGAFNLSFDSGPAFPIRGVVTIHLDSSNTAITYMYDLEGTVTDGTNVIIGGSFETGKLKLC